MTPQEPNNPQPVSDEYSREVVPMSVEAALAALESAAFDISPARSPVTARDLPQAIDTLAALAQRVEAQDAEIEQLRVQLAGCGVAAMCNTRESLATHCAIKPGDYGWTASFGDCVRAAEREIAEREAREAAEDRCKALEQDAARLRERVTLFEMCANTKAIEQRHAIMALRVQSWMLRELDECPPVQDIERAMLTPDPSENIEPQTIMLTLADTTPEAEDGSP